MGNDATPAKPIQLPYSIIMRKKIIYLMYLFLLTACENAPYKLTEIQSAASLASEPSTRNISIISLIQRKKQQAAIESTFLRITSPERARQLAAICFEKTADTVFMPFDLAEIALAETGGHQLSARAVSGRGARGVWQLMPVRARSHGYSANDMLDDGKCAEAAVRELYTKLDMAQGNLERAKKYYCGQGPQATAYMKKIRRIRKEMVAELTLMNDKLALADPESRIR
ncbi:MAG: transglycosylase SLT domain-containing protein [Desulfuromonadaceae bacterium]|nr:transglycosylase SLT domain-containing protein [Desulfuromonadaceae bacterium]